MFNVRYFNSPETEMYLKNHNSKFEAEIGLSKCFQDNRKQFSC